MSKLAAFSAALLILCAQAVYGQEAEEDVRDYDEFAESLSATVRNDLIDIIRRGQVSEIKLENCTSEGRKGTYSSTFISCSCEVLSCEVNCRTLIIDGKKSRVCEEKRVCESGTNRCTIKW